MTDHESAGLEVRITLRDQEQTISFLRDGDTAQRLVAGCSVRPATIGNLLVATDIYQLGLTTEVMSELMQFDNELRSQGDESVRKAIRRARKRKELYRITFQAFDDLSESEATEPRSSPLVLFDLSEKTIYSSSDLALEASGEVIIHDGQRVTNKTVTYFLPEEWSIQHL